ncbi:hypothetical protein GCM10009541_43600 [Micromonospora gifhornensis]|uniref:Uncharacterized protein n=1 Tax=Micromonospora gifhornensis TaxID=84594 RepID=A0ABQ4IE98_9ACTN|nr:hypothetical protein Vgi01_28910 [Micromonospora gifhornensis]
MVGNSRIPNAPVPKEATWSPDAHGMRGRRGVKAVVIGIVCALVLALGLVIYVLSRVFEDTRPNLTSDIVLGTWRDAGGGEFTFDADGTFRAGGIPVLFFGPPRTTAPTMSGAGAWKLKAPLEDPAGRLTTVSLAFNSLDQSEYGVPYGSRLLSQTVDGSVILYWYVGDADLNRRMVLEKV